eukprot:CFRG1307T1
MGELYRDNFALLEELQLHLDTDVEMREEIRTVARSIERDGKAIQQVLQKLNQAKTPEQDEELCAQGEQMLEAIKPKYALIREKIPEGQFYKYNDIWRFTMVQLVFSAALIQFTRTGRLLSKEDVTRLLGFTIGEELTGGFHVDIEEYLHGICLLSQFLSRLAVNSVTSGKMNRPGEVLAFLSELLSAFQTLNFRNDGLRKKFDAMKYDLMKVEEVVYDLSVRRLTASSSHAPDVSADKAGDPVVVEPPVKRAKTNVMDGTNKMGATNRIDTVA